MNEQDINFAENLEDVNQTGETWTIEQAMHKAGGFGRYQCFTLQCLILASNGPGIVVYGIAYYQLQPPYICTY